MTLDEMLALLADNTTGDISAEDMRDVVTGVWDAGAKVEARVAALELSTGGAAGWSVSGIWQVNPQAGTNPGGKQVTCDTGTFATATWLRFDPQDKDNTDYTAALEDATTIYAQQRTDAGSWVRYSTGGATVGSGYVEVAVQVLGASTDGGSGSWQDAIVVMQGAPS